MKQYADHRKKQGNAIKEKAENLQSLNNQLVAQKKEKQQLVVQNRKAKKELNAQKKKAR